MTSGMVAVKKSWNLLTWPGSVNVLDAFDEALREPARLKVDIGNLAWWLCPQPDLAK